MSTKAHIYTNQDFSVEVYHETIEERYDVLGNHLGFDIHFILNLKDVTLIKHDHYGLEVNHNYFGLKRKLSFNFQDIESIEIDSTHIDIRVKGDTDTAQEIKMMFMH